MTLLVGDGISPRPIKQPQNCPEFAINLQTSKNRCQLHSADSIFKYLLEQQKQETFIKKYFFMLDDQYDYLDEKRAILELEAFNHDKIRRRLEQTERNNRGKVYCDKFILRACRMDYIPADSYYLMSGSNHLMKLKELDLSEMDLKSLRNLPNFPFLLKLNLIMNFITDDQIIYILKFKKLEVLYLTENFIKEVETIKSLKALPALKEIDVTMNPVQYDRTELFQALKLKIVDRFTASGIDLHKNRLFATDQDGNQIQSEEESEEQSEQEEEEEMEGQEGMDEQCEDDEQEQEQEEEDSPEMSDIILTDGKDDDSYEDSQMEEENSESQQEYRERIE